MICSRCCGVSRSKDSGNESGMLVFEPERSVQDDHIPLLVNIHMSQSAHEFMILSCGHMSLASLPS